MAERHRCGRPAPPRRPERLHPPRNRNRPQARHPRRAGAARWHADAADRRLARRAANADAAPGGRGQPQAVGILDRRIDSHPRTHSRAARARQTIAARSVRHAWGCAQRPARRRRKRNDHAGHGGWRPPRGQARRAGRQAAGCRPAGTAGRRTRLVFRHTTAAHAEPGHATCGAESTEVPTRRLSPWSRPMSTPPAVAEEPPATGTPKLVALQPRVDFGTTPVEGRLSGAVRFGNEGTAPATLAAPRLDGADAGSFRIVVNTCEGTLAPGRTCEVNLGFQPLSRGERNAALVIALEDGSQQSSVALAGTALPPAQPRSPIKPLPQPPSRHQSPRRASPASLPVRRKVARGSATAPVARTAPNSRRLPGRWTNPPGTVCVSPSITHTLHPAGDQPGWR